MANKNLCNAKKAKNDEFYTQISDIEKELKHYKHHFKDKVIFCNCDDPDKSHFYKYFKMNFEALGLKKLITTHYKTDASTYKIECYGSYNTKDIKTVLKQNGDFRSDECIELLKESDIVVTNPPFSLFREYIALLEEYNKKYVIIGNKNAIIYKDTFKLIKDDKLWLGYTSVKEFRQPDGTIKKFGNIGWFTNLPIDKRNEKLFLHKTYSSELYPKYDNYDAINVNKVKDIPCDYDGVMGVPVTFLDKYNPEQFELLGVTKGRDEFGVRPSKRYINPVQINKDGTTTNGSKANTGVSLLLSEESTSSTYYTADNADSALKLLYTRILIRRITKDNT